MTSKETINEAIILAGGLGTRLKEVIGDYPKPMAPIQGRPFLSFLFDYLIQQKITRVILAVGYKSEKVIEFYGNTYRSLELVYSKEDQPLGTGGAIRLALKKLNNNNAYVLNGDTIFNIALPALGHEHIKNKSICTIALKALQKFDRYGTVNIEGNQRITEFLEKRPVEKGLINGGIYCVQKTALAHFKEDIKFSFETDFLEKNTTEVVLYGIRFEGYFKDIGIPRDYKQFEEDSTSEKFKFLQPPKLSQLKIDSSWTLFLDRDGVINERLIDDYVKQLHELRILPNIPKAIATFSQLFNKIIVVTNQQGIGRGMMNADDLAIVHGFIEEVIKTNNGKIDRFYFAPQLRAAYHIDRKPRIGMGLSAKADYPEIDFEKAIMVGDSETDIEFGMKLGMKTIMLKTDRNVMTKADYIFENLYDVSKALTEQ